MKTKGIGFFRALIVAIVSFLIIFFFFPDAAAKYFGVNVNGKVQVEQFGQDIVDSVKEKVVDNVSQKISDLIGTPSGK